WETCPFRGRQPCAERRRSYGKPAGAASTFQRRGSGDMTSDTPHPVPARRMVVRSRLRPGLPSQLPPDRATMKPAKPRALLLSLAITALVAGCGGRDADAPAQSTAQPSSDAGALTLDESKLPGVNRFLASDIDPAVDACTDFGGHVNGKWLAANEIPGDRTSWGAFEMLDERSTAAQRQLVEQAAADEDADGVTAIVGDFWATGMDTETINAQGIAPLQDELDAIAAIDSPEAIAEYLRSSAAEGRNFLFGFGAEADFKDSDMNIAYAVQGGLGLPDKGYYFDADKKDKLEAYQQHVARVLELSGLERAEAERQAADVVAFETRLAGVSK